MARHRDTEIEDSRREGGKTALEARGSTARESDSTERN